MRANYWWNCTTAEHKCQGSSWDWSYKAPGPNCPSPPPHPRRGGTAIGEKIPPAGGIIIKWRSRRFAFPPTMPVLLRNCTSTKNSPGKKARQCVAGTGHGCKVERPQGAFFFLVRSLSGANQKKNASEDVRPCSYEQDLLACSGPF